MGSAWPCSRTVTIAQTALTFILLVPSFFVLVRRAFQPSSSGRCKKIFWHFHPFVCTLYLASCALQLDDYSHTCQRVLAQCIRVAFVGCFFMGWGTVLHMLAGVGESSEVRHWISKHNKRGMKMFVLSCIPLAVLASELPGAPPVDCQADVDVCPALCDSVFSQIWLAWSAVLMSILCIATARVGRLLRSSGDCYRPTLASVTMALCAALFGALAVIMWILTAKSSSWNHDWKHRDGECFLRGFTFCVWFITQTVGAQLMWPCAPLNLTSETLDLESGGSEQLLGDLSVPHLLSSWSPKPALVTQQNVDAVGKALVAVPGGALRAVHEVHEMQLAEQLSVAKHAFLLPGMLAAQLFQDRGVQLQGLEVVLRQLSSRIDLETQLCSQPNGCSVKSTLLWLEKRADLVQLRERLQAILDRWYRHLERLDSMARLYPLLHWQFEGIGFRPSNSRSHQGLAGVPINMQKYMVKFAHAAGAAASLVPRSSPDPYCVLTVGAPAAHCFGYKPHVLSVPICSSSADADELSRIERELYEMERADVSHCQAIGVAAASVQLGVERCTEAKDWPWLVNAVQEGVLLHWAGMLSTYGNETRMMEDHQEAVGWMDCVRVAWSCTACTAIELKWDDAASTSAEPVLSVSLPAHWLPPPLLSMIAASTPQRLRVALFSVGVNEMQTFANCWGDRSLEIEINQEGLGKLQQATHAFAPGEKKRAAESALRELEHELEHPVGKQLSVLSLSAACARALGAVQLCSCKSAKDRTSMFVTLETSLLASSNERRAADVAEQLRVSGVRLQNCGLNTGDATYAFNCFQVRHLPSELRPPADVRGCRHS